MKCAAGLLLIAIASALADGETPAAWENVIHDAFAGRQGALVMVDCSSGATRTFQPQLAAERIAPCSTFKIWNTLIGLETGIISTPDQPFYKWDGQERSIAAWDRDLTLQEAFRASCVPAFQSLAREIGHERMRSWLAKVRYGDGDISAGIDVFWLPAKGRKTVLISPAEQAQLMRELVTGSLPFSRTSRAVLKDLMSVSRTERGTLYGKTGSGTDERGTYTLGWFVGYVESKGNTCAFACAVKGENVMGKDARAIVESVLEKQRLL